MNSFPRLILLFGILPALFFPAVLFAQNKKGGVKTHAPLQKESVRSYSPKWIADFEVTAPGQGQKKWKAPACADCELSDILPNLPVHSFWVPVNAYNKINATVINTEYEETPASTLYFQESIGQLPSEKRGEWYPSSHIATGEIVHRGAETLQEVRIYPVLVHADGKQIRKIKRISYLLTPAPAPENPPQTFRNYAPHSVLKEGDWYKLAVKQEGIYKLDYNYLNALGINPGSINPAKIRVFGNGGKMIPQANAEDRFDDLTENPVYVSAQGAAFGPDDYILFYGQAPHTWTYSETENRFVHKLNLYSDTAFYFLNIGTQNGLRIQDITVPMPPATPLTQTQNYGYYETEKENFGKSGRYWVGELFSGITERTISFPVQDILAGSEIKVTIRAAARSDVNTYFTISAPANTNKILGLDANLNSPTPNYYNVNQATFTFSADAVQGDSLRLLLNYNKNNSGASDGYLDWIEVEYTQDMDMKNLATRFLSVKEMTPGNQIASFSIQNAPSGARVWDITNPVSPVNIPVTFSGNTLSGTITADTTRRFITFSSQYKSPVSSRKIPNQDLHALEVADYIMIVPPDFESEAERLADFHRTNLGHSVHVVNPGDIYNEYSGGKQDVSGIRDFLKMFHDRSGGAYPKYVLLFGDGSYDYKNIKGTGRNFIPTYQSRNYTQQTGSYTSDDFFVFLSDDEGFFGEQSYLEGDTKVDKGQTDAGIGRFPVETLEEAKGMVDKTIEYAENKNLGQWKNKVVLVADYKQNEEFHMSQADSHAAIISAANPCINLDKIYFDNYTASITGSTMSFPGARQEVLQKFDEGALFLNWTGHGSETAWSNSFTIQNNDILNIENHGRNPAIITATCEFGRYDNPDLRTGAELFALNPDGGAIAMFTTVRLVYADPNAELNRNIYREAFVFDTLTNRMPTLGEILQRTKNRMYKNADAGNTNSRNFTLLGDPGLTLAYPRLSAVITEINGSPVVSTESDTIPILKEVEIKGRVENADGIFQSQFNGDMDATIFDKANLFITKQAQYAFNWQKNRIFNGQVSVKNGLFSFKFVVPIDVSYDEGFGKISLYFNDENTDGAGCFTKLFIAGTDSNSINDKIGPDISLYINDNEWISGGTTFPDPDLYAEVSDESGINITNTGIGHEITATLNGDKQNPILLNEYYTAQKDNYKDGSIRYKMRELTPGEYTLNIRVWDVANNSSEAQTRFILAENADMALTQILNYPNPFSTNTEFFIGHNQVGKDLYAQIKIFSITGKLVKTLEADFYGEGNYFRGITWDGLDEYGDKIGRGTYVYQVTLKELSSSKSVSKFEKLVLIR